MLLNIKDWMAGWVQYPVSGTTLFTKYDGIIKSEGGFKTCLWGNNTAKKKS